MKIKNFLIRQQENRDDFGYEEEQREEDPYMELIQQEVNAINNK